MRIKAAGFFVLIVLLLSSCNSSNKPDISEIEIDMEFYRFDQDLNNCKLENLKGDLEALSSSYGEFYKLFSYKIVGAGEQSSNGHVETMKKYITHFSMNFLMENVQKEFKDDAWLRKDIKQAFSYFHYFFPDVQVPNIYMFMGGLNQSIVVADSILGVALEKYLGTNWEGYNRFGINNYLRKNMHAEKIPSDCIRAWALTEFEFNDSVDNFLSSIVYQGMIQHVIDKCLPKQADSVKFGYTAAQMEWCKKNESNMWHFLVEEKLLFSTDKIMVNKFIGEAPFTSMFTQKSPGRAVVFLGYKIIEKYLDKNPGVTLGQLMKKSDYQQILQASKYMP